MKKMITIVLQMTGLEQTHNCNQHVAVNKIVSQALSALNLMNRAKSSVLFTNGPTAVN